MDRYSYYSFISKDNNGKYMEYVSDKERDEMNDDDDDIE